MTGWQAEVANHWQRQKATRKKLPAGDDFPSVMPSHLTTRSRKEPRRRPEPHHRTERLVGRPTSRTMAGSTVVAARDRAQPGEPREAGRHVLVGFARRPVIPAGSSRSFLTGSSDVPDRIESTEMWKEPATRGPPPDRRKMARTCSGRGVFETCSSTRRSPRCVRGPVLNLFPRNSWSATRGSESPKQLEGLIW